MAKRRNELGEFFARPVNSVTRERIFFKRLSFDLTIAAARADYHLHLYEPDVDRDGFDIVVEDEDRVGWYQTKAVLSSAATSAWKTTAGFLRPADAAAEAYGFDPPDAGRGGGIILIEIDDSSDVGGVTYRYTDFDILVAIAEGFLVERHYGGRGRPAEPSRKGAQTLIKLLRDGPRGREVEVGKNLFVTAAQSDDLLGLMGMRSNRSTYEMFTTRAAYSFVCVDNQGMAPSGSPTHKTAALVHHMGILCKAQPTADGKRKLTLFDPLKWDGHPGASADTG